ncbi:MAG: RIP metalloprotease RseP [Kiritimatiellia bacterium]|jgi:regulator of sigma E protease|nr:RIP metalloprotease RseP [Kiritimatiellia bacterium]MDP6809096.1 RIP metalloprotease RseP [Kiritimatiellia bacterium]MDP7023212.1 RIP metalloprotease RseP [Kiritimatiellia bacterium]
MLALFDSAWIIPILVLLFGVTIFIHELGHYLTARWLGLVVEVFSIGFGPSIWEKKIKGIRYKIGCIPFGGYVALPQLDPSGMSHIQGSDDEAEAGKESRPPLPSIAPWRKIIVSAAGAIGNTLLAILIAWLVFWIGIPAGPSERSSVVGFVAPESAAYVEDLRIGDEVVAVNGTPVKSWRDVRLEVALNQTVTLSVRRLGVEGTREIILETGEGIVGEASLEGVSGCNLCQVLQVTAGMSAESAGVQADDVITEFDGVPVWSRGHLSELVGQRQGRTVPMKVQRETDEGRQELELTVTPAFDVENNKARIGIVFNTMAVEHDTIVRPRPMEQLRGHASAIVRVLRALVTPRQAKAASQAVGGPVAIMISYWAIVKTSIMLAVWFTGFLNVNLAILNLLPIPVLDGGHIVFSLWELIFRKPVSPKFVNALVNVFAVLLIGVMILLSVRDLDRFTSLGSKVRKLLPAKVEEPQMNTDERE